MLVLIVLREAKGWFGGWCTGEGVVPQMAVRCRARPFPQQGKLTVTVSRSAGPASLPAEGFFWPPCWC